ncbi:hypothetical protein [Vibrio ouci]|uniref:hypothetical protein n=1 Tax=Vibrio ouci TaxID=2499078 RepID=UPI00142E556F|nr:hypothetical protein [Vibrio ouci]
MASYSNKTIRTPELFTKGIVKSQNVFDPELYLSLLKGDWVELNRSVLHQWHQASRERGGEFNIQAGFGWNQTMARVYESSFLNQEGAPNYLRVSIGIEPVQWIEQLAQSLITTVKRLMSDRERCVGR